jgi:hypothetical protein
MGGQTDPVADGKPNETQLFYSGSWRPIRLAAEKQAQESIAERRSKANPELAKERPRWGLLAAQPGRCVAKEG